MATVSSDARVSSPPPPMGLDQGNERERVKEGELIISAPFL